MANLREIRDYIAQDSPEAADRFAHEVVTKARSLEQLSERGRRVPENPELRELILGNYRLLYQVKEDEVGVIALVHGRRDLRSLLRRRNQD